MRNFNLLKGVCSVVTFNNGFAVFFITMMLVSCSTEEIKINSEIVNQELGSAELKQGIHYETWQDQVDRLTKKTQKFRNFQVAQAQGWNTQVTDHIPGMGMHFLNPDLADNKFEMEKPEALLYVATDEGMQFVAVEYLIFGPSSDPAPEGFLGDKDVWVYNEGVQAWTLHAWVAMENSDGVFAATNPDVD